MGRPFHLYLGDRARKERLVNRSRSLLPTLQGSTMGKEHAGSLFPPMLGWSDREGATKTRTFPQLKEEGTTGQSAGRSFLVIRTWYNDNEEGATKMCTFLLRKRKEQLSRSRSHLPSLCIRFHGRRSNPGSFLPLILSFAKEGRSDPRRAPSQHKTGRYDHARVRSLLPCILSSTARQEQPDRPSPLYLVGRARKVRLSECPVVPSFCISSLTIEEGTTRGCSFHLYPVGRARKERPGEGGAPS
jgi:hypothetical protein